jgi:hypothetical protein
MVVDIGEEAGRQVVLELCRDADILIEGFRPGVMERRSGAIPSRRIGRPDCQSRHGQRHCKNAHADES